MLENNFPKIKTTYLDSGATTLTPNVVLDAMNEYYTQYRANIHRGVYDASIQATEKYEGARADIARFINAQPNEIIFTPGTTFGLNQLAYSLGPRLSHHDNIVLTKSEHHANLVPWQQMAKHFGFEIRFIELKGLSSSATAGDPHATENVDSRLRGNDSCELDLSSAANVIDANTKIVSLTYISNVLGIINPVQEIIKIARAKNPKVYTIIDAAQAMAHIPVDVQKLDCDFLVFSGHKMYGPTGIGVMYGKKIMLEEHLEPFLFGGDMIKSVSFDNAVWNDLPWRFEAGTPNIAGAIGLGAAVRFIESISWKALQEHEQKLTKLAFEKLRPLVRVIDAPSLDHHIGIISFTIPDVHPHDIGDIMNQEKVAVRVGFHCAEPLHHLIGLNQGTVRASLGMYNTEEDIENLVKAIGKVKMVFA